jgi:hypothetical protein
LALYNPGNKITKTLGIAAKVPERIGWAGKRGITQADLPPGYTLDASGNVRKPNGQFASELETASLAGWKTSNGTWFPKDDGFLNGVKKEKTLSSGTLDRYVSTGSTVDNGSFASPVGTPFEARSLPNPADSYRHVQYEILKPIPVLEGKAAAWFGQPGGATQWKIDGAKLGIVPAYIQQELKSDKWSMEALVRSGYLARK